MAAAGLSTGQTATPDHPETRLYEIRDCAGKGKGLFAAKDIDAGTRIIAEPPLMAITKRYYMKADAEAAFDQLSAEAQAQYASLASAHGQDPTLWPSRIHPSVEPTERQRIEEQHGARTGAEPTILSTMMANAMPWSYVSPGYVRQEGTAVFETAARCNHSCVPNAHFAWNDDIDNLTVHATKAIAAGTEVTVAYCDPTYIYGQRAAELRHYGFKCNCPACQLLMSSEGSGMPALADSASRGESLRLRFREIDTILDIKRSLFRGTWPQFPDVDVPLVNLMMEQEQILDQLELVTVERGSLSLQISDHLVGYGDLHMALARAEHGYRIIVMCEGEDSPLTKWSRDIVERIRNAQRKHFRDFRPELKSVPNAF